MSATRVYPVILGCPKNRTDTEKLLWLLKQKGAQLVLDPEEANLLLVSTCAFIREAVEESIDVILELAEGKRPGQRLVVIGCLVARYQEDLLEALPEVDLFLGIEAYRNPEAVFSEKRYCLRLQGPECPQRVLTASPFYAYLKITEGCRHACRFCLIPRLRGPLRSLPEDFLLKEAQNLLVQGVQEIILVGQDVSAYGLDQGKRRLVSLLKRLLSLSGLKWLRLLYLHPEGLEDALLDLMAQEPRLCPYLDLPIQHASPAILDRMKRPYDPEQILGMIQKVRREIPEVALRTSVIVGFPGETEKDFVLLLDFLKEAQFDHLGAFIFSPEEGTPAAKMSGQISEEEKRARFEEVMLLQQEISRKRLAARLGKETQVLVEGWDDKGSLYGHALFQAPEIDGLIFLEGEATPGEIITVVPHRAETYDLWAEIKPEERR